MRKRHSSTGGYFFTSELYIHFSPSLELRIDEKKILNLSEWCASKVLVKILQARLQQYVNFEMCKLGLEKAEEPEIKLPTFVGP